MLPDYLFGCRYSDLPVIYPVPSLEHSIIFSWESKTLTVGSADQLSLRCFIHLTPLSSTQKLNNLGRKHRFHIHCQFPFHQLVQPLWVNNYLVAGGKWHDSFPGVLNKVTSLSKKWKPYLRFIISLFLANVTVDFSCDTFLCIGAPCVSYSSFHLRFTIFSCESWSSFNIFQLS